MRQKPSKTLSGILGQKRIKLLASLMAGFIFLSFYHFVVLQPENIAMGEDLNRVRQDIISMEGQIRKLRADYLTFNRQKDGFDRMKAQGFLEGQNRLVAQKSFDRLKEKSGLLDIDFEIGPMEVLEGGFEKDVTYRLLKSGVKVSLKAKDDESLYRFLSLLDEDFPGLVSVEDIHIRRGGESDPFLVSADMNGDWQTIVPEESSF